MLRLSVRSIMGRKAPDVNDLSLLDPGKMSNDQRHERLPAILNALWDVNLDGIP
jgi:hypothetical protein